jgi:hypothetical protein
MEKQEDNETPKKSLKERLKSAFQTRHIIGLIIGAIAGISYYFLVGCKTGACGLKANPYYDIVLGLALGYLIADMIKFKKK